MFETQQGTQVNLTSSGIALVTTSAGQTFEIEELFLAVESWAASATYAIFFVQGAGPIGGAIVSNSLYVASFGNKPFVVGPGQTVMLKTNAAAASVVDYMLAGNMLP